MSMIMKNRNIKKRLINESGGSFSAVHKALREAKKDTQSRTLDIEDVIKRLNKSINKENIKKAS